MFRKNLTAALFYGIFLLASVNCLAGIAEFNEAMKNGDYQGAAKEANAIWENFDKDGKQTAIVAREFGFVNYLARDYANAETLARFLVDNGQSLSVPDDQPATSTVLLRLALYGANPNAVTRDNLAQAVTARLDAQGVDQISLLGAETLFRNDWASGNWALLKDSASVAGQLYARAGAAYLKPLRETEIMVAASEFLQNPDYKDYDLIVTAHNKIVQDINDASNDKVQASLVELKWQAEAWAHTMEAYFHGNYTQLGSVIKNRLKVQELDEVPAALLPKDTTASAMPVCAGKVDVGDLTYPQRWAEHRVTGTVIMQLDFDENG